MLAAGADLTLTGGQTDKAPTTWPTAQRKPTIEPLGGRQFRVQFTVSAPTRDKLRLAQDLLRHQIPDGDLSGIIDRALTLLLEALAREKFAAAERPRTRAATGNDTPQVASRHIAAHVRRTVWLRDGGCCAFIGTNGRRCGARGFLEFHHVVPFSLGGDSTVANIELRCRAHNRYEAETYASGRALTRSAVRPIVGGGMHNGRTEASADESGVRVAGETTAPRPPVRAGPSER
jgi:hypothetical protein